MSATAIAPSGPTLGMDHRFYAPGALLGELSYYLILEEDGDMLKVVNLQHGGESNISRGYLDSYANHASAFASTEGVTKTFIQQQLILNVKVPMTVTFITKDKKKKVRDYQAEVTAAQDKLDALIAAGDQQEVRVFMTELIRNPILDIIPGEQRTMVGFHEGRTDERGRLLFNELDPENNTSTRIRLVDPRTVSELVLNDMKLRS